MKATILFYKPFILPCETKLTYSMSDGRTGETFFAWYKTFRGKTIDHYDLFPIFREVSKKGTMSNRSTPSLAYFGFSDSRNVDIIFPPESIVNIAKRLVRNNYDISKKNEGTIIKYVERMIGKKDGCDIDVTGVLVNSDNNVITVGHKYFDTEGKPDIEDAKFDIRSLPYDIQEKIIIALYDAGEGRKNNE